MVCGEPRFVDAERDVVANPVFLVEVLSESTEKWDRGAKFGHYRRLASLAEVLFVSQREARIEQYVRQPDDRWLLSEVLGVEGVVSLPSLGCDLPLSEVYAKVALEAGDGGSGSPGQRGLIRGHPREGGFLVTTPANAATDLFARRRERFFDRVKEGVAILFATPEQHLSWDGEYRYRPDPDLFYLTGFGEPETVAVLDAGARAFFLFVRPRDRERETWTGGGPGRRGR